MKFPWLMAVWMVATAAAAPAASAAAPLTLAAALEQAFVGNETPQIAKARVDAAKASLKQAYSALLPSLSVAYSYRQFSAMMFGFGQGGFLPPGHIMSAGVRINVFSPVALAQLAVAQKEIAATQAEAQETQRVFAFDVAQAYLGVIAAQAVERAAQERRSVAAQMFEEATLRARQGLLSANAATRAELELKTAELALIEADRTVVTARLGLSYLLNAEVHGDLAEPGVEWFSVERDIQPDPFALRPDYQAAVARTQAAQRRTWIPWLRFIPTIDVEARFIQDVQALLQGQPWGHFIGGNVTWELYDGGARYAERRLRNAEERQERLGQRALGRQIPVDIDVATAELQAASAAAEQAEAAVAVAIRNQEEVEQRFSNGLSTALELADATASLFEARAELARQQFAHRIARMSIQQALGFWPGLQESPAQGP